MCIHPGDTKCRDFDCQDITGATSQVDCDLGALGKTCVYLLGTYYNKGVACTTITAKVGNEKAYCDQVTAATSCAYITGTTCAIEQACYLYSVSKNQVTVCATLTDASGKACTYIGGNNSATVSTCDTYDGTTTAEKGPQAGSEEAKCKGVKSDTKYPCIKNTDKKCKAQVCTDNDTNATDCANNAVSIIQITTLLKLLLKLFLFEWMCQTWNRMYSKYRNIHIIEWNQIVM